MVHSWLYMKGFLFLTGVMSEEKPKPDLILKEKILDANQKTKDPDGAPSFEEIVGRPADL